jgi:hypothetical protein
MEAPVVLGQVVHFIVAPGELDLSRCKGMRRPVVGHNLPTNSPIAINGMKVSAKGPYASGEGRLVRGRGVAPICSD